MVIPFQIVISGRGSNETYGLRVQAAGRSAEALLTIPAEEDSLEAYGAALGQAVFSPTVRQLLLDVARGADEAGARIQLQLRVSPPELLSLPWEWMSLGTQNLWQPAIRDDYTLVRVIQGLRPLPALAVATPLRLLIATAPGCDDAADMLGAALASAVRSHHLIVDRLRNADAAGLTDALAEEPCHLLHLIAPVAPGMSGGPARAAQPRLRLGRSIDPTALASILEEYPELRMVTLAANEPGASEPMAALAAALHESRSLTTIALGDLDATAAADFCATCYTAVSAGEPVDMAATYGRAQLANSGGLWGTPLIFMVPGGEMLFRLGEGEQTPAPRPARTTRPETRRKPARRTPTSEEEPIFRPISRPQPHSAMPGQAEGSSRPIWLTRRVIVLIVASIILIFMVSRSLRWSDQEVPTPPATATMLIMPTSQGTSPTLFTTPAIVTPVR